MIAWSLSGGSNRGPIQVGAMRALFDAGVVPDILVGTSAGALNTAFLAYDPSPAGAERLAQIWLSTRKEDIFPGNWLTRAIRFVLGFDSLDPETARRAYVEKNTPPGLDTFGNLKIKLYLTTADLETGELYLYGDDPSASVVEAALASSAQPVVWPPEVVGGHQFVDGAVVANVPISIAIDKGADIVYALDLEGAGPYPVVHGVYNIARRTIGVMVYQQLLRDIERALRFSKVTLHHIYMGDLFGNVREDDFSHTAEMIQQGYERARGYLHRPAPNQIMRAGAAAVSVVPPGAAPYHPPR